MLLVWLLVSDKAAFSCGGPAVLEPTSLLSLPPQCWRYMCVTTPSSPLGEQWSGRYWKGQPQEGYLWSPPGELMGLLVSLEEMVSNTGESPDGGCPTRVLVERLMKECLKS